MTTLNDIRQQYPQYNDLSDQDLAERMYQRFYSDMPREEFDARIGFEAPSPESGTGFPRTGTWIDLFTQGGSEAELEQAFNQGMTLGFADEMAGALAAVNSAMGIHGPLGPMEPGAAYEAYRDRARARLADVRSDRPIASVIAEIVGAVPPALLSRGGTMRAQVAEAAGFGAIYGAGSGDEGNRVGNAIAGAAMGGVGGVVTSFIGRVIGKAVERSATGKTLLANAPEPDEVKTLSQEFYRAHPNVLIRPNALSEIVQDVVRVGTEAGLDEGVTPKAFAAVRRLQREAASGQPITLEKLDQLRQVVSGAMPEGSAAATQMFARLTERINALSGQDVIGPSPEAAVAALNEARGLWSRYAKSQVVSAAIANAAESASGFENGLRNSFRALLRVDRKGRPKFGWTDDERAAIQQVVRGTTGSNLLRFLGTFGYSTDQARSWLGAVAGGGLGAFGGGTLGAIAVPALGTAAKAGARAMTGRAANVAEALALSGGALPATQVGRLTEITASLLLGALSKGASGAAVSRAQPSISGGF